MTQKDERRPVPAPPNENREGEAERERAIDERDRRFDSYSSREKVPSPSNALVDAVPAI